MNRELVLTPVDEAIVILVKGIRPITASDEDDGGDALGPSSRVKVEGDFFERTNGGSEQVLSPHSPLVMCDRQKVTKD